MSEIQAHPENEEEYENRRQELITDAAQTKQEFDAKQENALDAISEGGNLERYETVELGNLEVEVKAWLPGGVADTVQEAAELGESDDLGEVKKSMETMLDALAEMTVSDDYGLVFWREYYTRYGPEGLVMAVESVLEPATEELESKRDGVESFRSGQGN